MADTVKEWAEENCRPSGKNKLVCEKDNELVALDVHEQGDEQIPATDDNIEQFLQREKADDVTQQV
jgi:hypothetical protein